MRPGEEIRVEGGRFERLVVVRELRRPPEGGPIGPAAFVAHAYGPEGAELVVAERYRNLSPPSRDALLADVARTAALRFPNLAQVQDASRAASDVFVTTAFVEGELLGALRELAFKAERPISIDVGVRIVVDVLAALSAIHTDKGGAAAKGAPPPSLVHGAVAPHTIAVGFDGVTRLLRPYVGRLISLNLDAATVPYAAPEQLRNGKGSPRADIYSIGVVLWEMLSQTRLFEKATREGRLARATMPAPKLTLDGEKAWAAPLSPIVEKALSIDPLARYGTAAEMAAAVRLAVRAKLAMPARVAEIVDRNGADRILARRGEFALPAPPSGDRRSVRPSVPDGTTRALANLRPSSRPPTPTPAAVAPLAVPKAPPVPVVTKPRPPNPGPRPAMGQIELSPVPPSVSAPDSEDLELLDEPESLRIPPLAAAPPPVPAHAPVANVPPPVLPIDLADSVLEPAPESVPLAPVPSPFAAPLLTPATTAASPVRPEPTSAPALHTPDAIAVPADDHPAGVPTSRRKWLPALLLLIPVFALILFFVLRNPGVPPKDGPATGTTLVPPPPTTLAATGTATGTVTSTAATTTGTASSSPTVDTSATPSASASASATGTTTAWPRPSSSTARPKPTYDPEGI